MKVERIAECSPWSILQYFWPALSDDRSWKPIFLVFFDMFGPIISEIDPPFFALWVTSAHQSWKKSKALGYVLSFSEFSVSQIYFELASIAKYQSSNVDVLLFVKI